jgi:hypothetical protein
MLILGNAFASIARYVIEKKRQMRKSKEDYVKDAKSQT